MFSDRTIKVALIDSGLDNKNFNVIDNATFYFSDSNKISKGFNHKPQSMHGTLVASCITSICNNVQFIDLNIVDEYGTSNGMLLLSALKYCLSLDIDVINISLGTTNIKYLFKMSRIVRKLHKKHITIIAAENNGNRKAYPANLKYVIGVKGDSTLPSYKNFYYKNNFYYAYNKLPGNININDIGKNIFGNSFACGFVTGQKCNELLTQNY